MSRPRLVEELDFGPLIRAREDSGPDDTGVARDRRDEIIARLSETASEWRRLDSTIQRRASSCADR